RQWCEQMSDPKTPRGRRLARFELNLNLNVHGRIGDSLRAVATVLHSGLSTGAGGSRVEGDGRLVATPAIHHLITCETVLMSTDQITIRGAREHNLKDVTLSIPRDRLVVFTGLSGSGKSSLAFDTIYAEGQRRYVESLSAYARQFLGQMEKPDVDVIEGLSPAISIDQKGTSRNPRSTVGTVTEVYDYLRLLFARVGHPHCPICGREIEKQTVEQMADQLERMPAGTRLMI